MQKGQCRSRAAELTRTEALGFLFILIYFPPPSPAFILSWGEWKEVWAGSAFSGENGPRRGGIGAHSGDGGISADAAGASRDGAGGEGARGGIEFRGEAARSFHLPACGTGNKRSWMREPGKK